MWSSGGISEPGVCPADDRPLLDCFTINYTSQPRSRKLTSGLRERSSSQASPRCAAAIPFLDRAIDFAKDVDNPMNRLDPLSHFFTRAHLSQLRSVSITFAAWGEWPGKVG